MKKKVKRKEMQHPITVETALMLKNIERSDKQHKGEGWLLSLNFCKEPDGMERTLKENNEVFGFIAIYCLVL